MDSEAIDILFANYYGRLKIHWHQGHNTPEEIARDCYHAGFAQGEEERARLRRLVDGLEEGFLDVCKQRNELKRKLEDKDDD